jgi:hypothetical protein
MAGFVALGGIVMVALTLNFYNNEDDVWNADLGSMQEDADAMRDGVFGGLIVFSVIAVITGLLGITCICKACKKNDCCNQIYTMSYGFVLTLVWFVFILVGGIVTGLATALPQAIQDTCDGKELEGSEQLVDTIDTIDSAINDYSGHLMCSYLCPCDQDDAQKWVLMTEEKLNEFERTKVPVTNGGLTNKNPLTDDDGNYRLIIKDRTTFPDTLYDTFLDCHDHLVEQKENEAQVDDGSFRRLQLIAQGDQNQGVAVVSQEMTAEQQDYSFVPEGDLVETGFAMLTYFEQKYECSGVCDTSLFFYDLNLSYGPPVDTCLSFMKEEVSGSMAYLGITSLIIGFICLIIWIAQYVLWCKYEEPKEQHPYNKN